MFNKKRVDGKYGHLSNAQCADALVNIFQQSKQLPAQLILGHLSGEHNSPELAETSICNSLSDNGYSIRPVASYRDRMMDVVEF
jgi:phosphoribosyl 1,2-cyclic phosphodiesterase